MATKTKRTKSGSVPKRGKTVASFDDKMAHYSSPDFIAAAVQHFHSAKRRALAAQLRQNGQPGAESKKSR